VLRALLVLPGLLGLLGLHGLLGVTAGALGLSGCKTAQPPTGFGVNLTIDSRPLSARAQITELLLSTAGAETYSRVVDVRGVVPSDGVVRTRYVPGVDTGELSFSIFARDSMGAVRGLGAGTVTLMPGRAVQLSIDLADAPTDPPDGGMEPDLLTPLCSNLVLDTDEIDIDCGGSCPACEPGRACLQAADCATRTCINERCELASGPPGWVPVTSLPAARAFAAAAGLEDGRIYAIGGRVVDPDASVLMYAQASNDWTPVAALPAPRQATPAVVVADKIFVAGGVFWTTPMVFEGYASIVASNGSPPIWTTLGATLPVKRSYHGAAVGNDGRVYLIGGAASPAIAPLDTVLSFDPVAPTSGVITMEPATLPVARAELAAVADPTGRILAIGGRIADNSAVGDTTVFDPSAIAAAWASGPSLIVPRRMHGAALGADGRVYAVGGADTAGGPLGSVEVLSADGTRWLSAPPITPARYGVAVTRGWDGRLYAIGGSTMVARVVDVEAYGPRVSPGPAMGAAGAVIALSLSNFAADAKVTVTFSGDPDGKVAATGTSNDMGNVVPSLVWQVPPVAAGTYVLTAIDDRARYAVRARFVVP